VGDVFICPARGDQLKNELLVVFAQLSASDAARLQLLRSWAAILTMEVRPTSSSHHVGNDVDRVANLLADLGSVPTDHVKRENATRGGLV
jgi:hypothetical protein